MGGNVKWWHVILIVSFLLGFEHSTIVDQLVSCVVLVFSVLGLAWASSEWDLKRFRPVR
jgi:hypothetical protein